MVLNVNVDTSQILDQYSVSMIYFAHNVLYTLMLSIDRAALVVYWCILVSIIDTAVLESMVWAAILVYDCCTAVVAYVVGAPTAAWRRVPPC